MMNLDLLDNSHTNVCTIRYFIEENVKHPKTRDLCKKNHEVVGFFLYPQRTFKESLDRKITWPISNTGRKLDGRCTMNFLNTNNM